MQNSLELSQLRQAAAEYMQQHGLPHRRLENWKYTDLTRLFAGHSLTPIANTSTVTSTVPVSVRTFDDCYKALLVDGVFMEAQSQLPAGVEITSINHQEALNRALQRYTDWSAYPMLAANTAEVSDGLWISIAPGVIVDKPLHIIYHYTGTQADRMMCYRHVIQLSSDSQLTVIEEAQMCPEAFTLLNTVLQADIGEGARFCYYGIQPAAQQLAHVANLQITQQAQSCFSAYIAGLGAKVGRYDIHTTLQGIAAKCSVNGFYLVNQQQHFDLHSCFNHQASNTGSDELLKGIAAGKAHGVFNGKVLVAKGVQNIDARQSNPNLLLSLGAEIDSKPELEIYADAVKCSHGATVGQLDAQALFYLQSRGISAAHARQLLTQSFVMECVDSIPVEAIRDWLSQQVIVRLKEGF